MDCELVEHFDVVIMGAGIAGLSAARHLLLKCPELCDKRIAMIEPRTAMRNNLLEDFKVGESTVEISAMFFAKELELQDYLIENHPPKFSLQFHWPKDVTKTETMDDYYSTWSVKNPDVQSFQLNRAKMEKDMLQMVMKQGIVYYHGRVKDIDLAKGDEVKTIHIQLLSDEENFYDQRDIGSATITCDYVIDASGRNFVIGSRTQNVLKDPKDLFGLNNGSTWIRVKNFDRSLFNFPNENVTSSSYYCTNHFIGYGYWIWVIPIEKGGDFDLSIGVSYHKDKIDSVQLNSLDKFLGFLEKNQNILYKLVKSGEVVDLHKWPKICHTSKTFFSQDNWCVIGDAAAIFDPFYSTGMIMMAFEVQCATKIIQEKLILKKDVRHLHTLYDKFIRCITQSSNHLIKGHTNHLGNASVMSWRIYLESTQYFGVMMNIFIGKFHLCPEFLEKFMESHDHLLNIKDLILEALDYANENNINIGFMDNHRSGQLIFASEFCPTSTWDHDKILSRCKYEHKIVNLPKCIAWSSYYESLQYLMLFYRIYGISFFTNPKFLRCFSHSFSNYAKFSIIGRLYHFMNGSKSDNLYFDKMNQEFENYKYANSLIKW